MPYQVEAQHNGQVSALHRYSAKRSTRPVNFMCHAPGAQKVSVIGDFNGWEPNATPMKRQPDGVWMVQVQLCHGHHQYVFWVDGKAQLDPRAQGVARTEEGTKVSLLAIS